MQKVFTNTKLGAITAMLLIALIPILGCPTQNQIAALANILGTSAAQVAVLQGNTELGNKIKTDTAAAVTAITNWKKGTPSDNVIQIIHIVQDDLALIPNVGPYAPLIQLALATAASIIQLLQPSATSLQSPITPKTRSRVSATEIAAAPKTAAEYKKQWNAMAPKEAQLK